MSEFGELLRDIRQRQGITLRVVADKTGVSVPYWSDVEHGRRNPFRGEVLSRAARALNVEVDELEVAAFESRGSVTIELPDETKPELREVIMLFAQLVHKLAPPIVKEIGALLTNAKTQLAGSATRD